ncbi:MAG: ABC transporter substrate-binding protein [Chloroflexi bacterium]|nr:ABC transporter substrate-binding protein [Chloroflexota bacterium]
MRISSRLVITVLAILLLVMPLLAACDDDDETAPPTATDEPTATTEPTATAEPTAEPSPATPPPPAEPTEITLGLASFGNEVWLAPLAGATDNAAIESVVETLFFLDGDTYTPRLAESMEWNEDNTVYTFHLRQGVQFHDDWGEFTAEDVKYTMELAQQEGSQSTASGFFVDNLASIDVVDDYTVTVTFNSATSIPTIMGRVCGNTPPVNAIVSKNHIETVGQDEAMRHPIGTGPYTFVDSKMGVSVTLEKNPDYWGDEPYYDNVMLKLLPDDITRVAALQAGEIDATEISPIQVPEIEGVAGLGVIEGGVVYDESVLFGMQTDENAGLLPWIGTDDNALKVRKALALAIDKQEIIDFIFFGYGAPMSVWNFWPDSAYNDPSWTQYPFDPEQAAALLAEAGYPDGDGFPSITITTFTQAGRPTSPDVAQVVMGYWEEHLGIDVSVEVTDYAGTFKPSFFGSGGWEGVYTWPFSRRDAIENWGFGVLQFPVMAGYSELKALTATANGLVDPAARAEAAMAAGQWAYDNYVCVPIAGGKLLYGVDTEKVSTWVIPPAPYFIGVYSIAP